MKIDNSGISFRAGLTAQMKREISACDVKKITEEFTKSGVNADFKDNKAAAWCSLKCLEIIKYLNKEYHLNLGLPKGVYVEDFRELNINSKTSLGFLNLAPASLYKNSARITPEKSIFLNDFKEFNHAGGNAYWNRLDGIADENFDKRISATDFFLEPILHEFLHAVHEENLSQKLGGKKLVKAIQDTCKPEKLRKFRMKHELLLENICCYAAVNPFEAVACDMSKRAISNLDKETLLPQNNFIQESPYSKIPVLKSFFIKEDKLSHLLRRFWNGKFE